MLATDSSMLRQEKIRAYFKGHKNLLGPFLKEAYAFLLFLLRKNNTLFRCIFSFESKTSCF